MARVKPRRGPHRKFGSMRILSDGRVRFSEWTLPGLTQLDFITVYGERYEPETHSVHANWRGRPIFIVFVERSRVDSTCFAYQLTPDELRNAVNVMREAGSGLERWIAAGLEWTQEALKDKPEIQKVIPELLESVRDLPVAKQWKRKRREIQREWEKWRQENPDAVFNVSPWVLSNATLSKPSKAASRKAETPAAKPPPRRRTPRKPAR